jgi:hypothetical protein
MARRILKVIRAVLELHELKRHPAKAQKKYDVQAQELLSHRKEVAH